MDDARLDAIQARADSATKGPWEQGTGYFQNVYVRVAGEGPCGGLLITTCQESHDAIFIAHAREDVPALVAEVRRLRAYADELHEERYLLRESEARLDADVRRLREENARLGIALNGRQDAHRRAANECDRLRQALHEIAVPVERDVDLVRDQDLINRVIIASRVLEEA